eukprot:XP_020400166.1 uncharacterized protein LOC103638314 [Zea mays]
MGHNAGRTPFIDISNTSITGDQNGSNSLRPIVDANEHKRQRDKERYATMSIEQKNEKNRKRREARQRNKGLPIKSESSREDINTNQTREAVNVEISRDVHLGSGPIKNTPSAGNSIERKRQRDRERRATMSVEQRNEYNNKRCQMRQRNKGQNVMPAISGDGDKKVNVDPDDDSDWLHRNETFQSNDYVATTDLLPPGSVHESVGTIGESGIGVREYRLERLRLYNQTPKRKEAKIEYMRKHRVLHADTLNVVSIAMEDPTYTPEVVHPATEPSTVTACDWVIPEFVRTPFLPAQTQTEDVGSFDMSTEAIKRKHHVSRGERQAILARRNQQFQASIARNVTTLNGDTISDANNNAQCSVPCQAATLPTNGSEGITEQASGVEHTQEKPRVISNDDDDEVVIFGEDDDNDERYIFDGQYEETDEDIKIDGTQDESTGTDVPDPYDKVYSNLPEETHMLKPVPDCGYCTAKKFEYEPPGFCCRGGKVELAPLDTPPQLRRLWDSADSDAKHFRDNIRFFNGHFSFTSLYCCLDSMTTNVRDSGIYTFRAQGMMYHNIKSFGKEGGSEHKHLELYFYDDDPSLEHRYRKCREEQLQKDKEVIKQIVGILHGNPYSEHLRSLGHVENLDDYHIALNLDQTLNQKTYNTPLTSEVAAVWIEGSERGELGWHANIPKVGVSMDEMDAYRATYRANNANDENADAIGAATTFCHNTGVLNMLQSMGKDIKTFPLPPIIDTYDDAIGTAREGGLFFVDGPGGTGKTYLYRVLLATLRGQGKIVVATATSGVAASIMPGGRTAHSRFKIPLTIDDGAICSFTKQSGTAELLRKASLIIWDEASMTKRQAVEALDNSMRDIMGRPKLPFGGKTIVFGGDFRQVLPVVRKGSRAQVVASSLRMSYLWESMSHLKLVSNMRAKNDPWFAEYLLRVGDGTEDTNSDGDICLPDEVCVPYSGSDSDLDNLIDFVFPNLNENMSDSTYITSRAILSTRNDWVDMINAKMIDRFQGEHMVYHSFDSAMDDPHNYYPPEFLNTLTPNGLPPHVLKLKIGCPVILLRNIDPANGLCNGTRLVIRGFQRNSIDAEIVLGQHAGKRIFLPRIPLCPSDEEMFPFQFKRKQFPVRLSFAMTVNKAQGQTIPNVGVYLPEPVFSHGQLYVALSRATARSNIKILAIPAVDVKKRSRKGVKKNPTIDCGTCTKNIVYKEVLTN